MEFGFYCTVRGRETTRVRFANGFASKTVASLPVNRRTEYGLTTATCTHRSGFVTTSALATNSVLYTVRVCTCIGIYCYRQWIESILRGNQAFTRPRGHVGTKRNISIRLCTVCKWSGERWSFAVFVPFSCIHLESNNTYNVLDNSRHLHAQHIYAPIRRHLYSNCRTSHSL